MATVDTAWLRLDTASSRMTIVGVWLLRPGIQLQTLRARVSERLLRYGRFRQRVEEDGQGALWVEDPAFDLDRHVVPETLKRRRGQTGDAALQARVAELAADPLDRARPLWQFHLVEQHDGGSALIARLHHCIADGMALIAVMLSITDDGPPPPAATGAPGGFGSLGVDGDPEGLADAMLKPISDWTIKAIRESGATHAAGPEGLGTGVDAGELLGTQVANDLAALAFVEDDSPTRLKGRPGSFKRVAWGQGLPLDSVKAVSKSLGVSLNDVLLSCVAGAIGAYLRAKGDDTHGQEIRAMVPVNLRPLSQAGQLGNRFGVVPVVLPIGIANPVRRLYAVHARMREVKGSLQPVLAFGLMAAAGMLRPEHQSMLNDYSRKATAVMTNVPGPATPLRFCGSTVERVMFWVPQSGDIGMGVSLLTYAGQVQFGLMTDAGLCPDPSLIIQAFEPEFQKLLTLALMLPWEVPG
ncbi:wax ester/triacylglycerol synthase family O-acyltransferase [Roseateles amylovorans]|uniref:diacylglycerol O-acyltransferase n=2 Tax=Roseateles amylovorans TaxID=2978473 RepID=A0ABY6B723_9BURK|nr:wax ester/triacylglycerol synthase family O-acyltransferase [Roseateles amylovorans]UXH80982.1 wax ester/triacylglycerol synthase family O-acyltransferase [Roseateles amylovorans]